MPPNKKLLATGRNSLVVLVAACVLAVLGLIAPATAAAAGTPDIGLDKTQSAQALIGTQQEVHLTASNPAGQERGYNLSFRDVLPNGVRYLAGSASPVAPPVLLNAPNSNETTPIFENVADLSANSQAVESGTQIFEWRFKTKVKKEPVTRPEQITGNLMKFTYSNTIGETFPLRDRAEVERQEPELSLEKQIVEVGGTMVPRPPPGGKSTSTAGGGELVKYELEIENAGNLGAEETEVWDRLPEGIECADITLPAQTAPQTAECAGEFIKWTGVVVPQGELVKLAYELKVPTDVEPGHTFINKAHVTRYRSPTNTGEKFEYVTENNPNEALGPANTKAIEDEAELRTSAASLKKEQNKASATIGEIVTFTVTTTIPPNSKVFGKPAIKDDLPSGFQLVGAPSATLDNNPLGEGLALVALANGADVTFSGPYPESPSATAHTIVLTLEGRVRNVPANAQGVEIKNEASFTFDTTEGEPVESPPSAHTETSVVEPHLLLFKRLLPKEPEERATRVAPGEPVEYETEVVNTGGSTAYEVSVHDTIPNGMEIAAPGNGTPEEAGKKLSWTIAEIAPNGGHVSLVYTLRVKEPAPAASRFDNKVVATTQSQKDVGGVEPPETRDAGTPGAAAAGYEAKAHKEVQLIGATVSKSVTPGEGTIGSEMTYTLHTNLPAEIEFFNTTLVDQLPKGLNFVEPIPTPECEITSGPSKGQKCGVGTELPEEPGPEGTTLHGWYFGKYVAISGTRELTVKFKAIVNKEATAAELINKLAGFYNETEGAEPTQLPVPKTGSTLFSEETNVSEVPFKVFQPKLKLTKAVSGGVGTGGKTVVPGGTLSYTLTVKNEGTWPAYDFNVEDHPSANLTGFGLELAEGEAGTVTSTSTAPPAWHVEGPLPAGKELKLHYTAKLIGSTELANAEAVENKAEVPTYFGLKPSERVPPFVVEYPALEARQKLQVELPQPALEKTTGTTGHLEGEKADVGVGFPWRIVVGNTAVSAPAKEASVVDTLPENWSYVANSATVNGTKVEPTVTPGKPVKLNWTVPTLPANNPASTEILFEAAPGVDATAVKNEAVVTAKDESGSSGPVGKNYEAKGSATAAIVAPEFEVEKTPDGEAAVAGTEREYNIKVTNIGTGRASAPIKVEDQLGPEQNYLEPEVSKLPPGVAQVSVNPTSGKGPAQIIWTIASLEVGASITIPVPIEIPSEVDDGHTISDTAKVSSPQAPTVEEDPGAFLVKRETDREILKVADRANVNGGEFIRYTLTAINNGPSDASGVVVTDEIPRGTEFANVAVKAGSLGNCGYDAATKIVTCNVPVLVSEAKAEFEVEVEVDTGRLTPIFNTAKITGNEKDPEPENDEAKAETMIGGSADLLVRKSGPTQPVLLGGTFTYKLEVENEGPSNAEDVKVVDELPQEVEFIETTEPEGTSCAEVGGRLTCELGTLLPKTPVVVFEVTVKASALSPAGAKTLNTAEIKSITPDPETENNESSAEVEILPAADLAITKTAPATVEPNGELTYALHVENFGPSAAHHVKVTDPLPSGVEFLKASEGCTAAAGVVTCETPPAGELEVGGSADFQITVHVPYALGGQALVNTATVAADEADPRVENNSSTVTTDAGAAADLAITKTMGKAQAGQPLTYTLAVTNKGPSASTAVTVKDTLPAGTSFKSAAPSQGTCSAAGQTVTCDLGPLASGGSAQVSITVEVAGTATGSLRNVATVEGPLPDPDKSNNESAVEGPVAPPTATAPNLKVVKTADTSSPAVGTPFSYDVAVTNMGGGEARNVKVVDTLDGPVKVVSIEAGSGHCSASGSKITCTIPSIPVGKTVHITYSVVAEAAGPLSNTASAEAANGEKAPSNNHAVKSVKAMAPEGTFALTKTATRKVVPGGKKVGFTITLRNGATALTDAKVCDRLPAALVFAKAAAARYVNGEACWTKTYVAARKVLRFHLLARAVKGYSSRQARNVATASAGNATRRSASATVRVKPAFAGEPGGVTG